MNTTYNSVCVCATGTQVYESIAVHTHVVTFIVCIAITVVSAHACTFICIQLYPYSYIYIPHSNILIQ